MNENSKSPTHIKLPEFSQSPPVITVSSPSHTMLIEQPKSSPSVTLHYKPNNPKVGVIKPKQVPCISLSLPQRRSTDSEEIRYSDDSIIPYNSEGSPGYQVPNSPGYQLHSPPNYFNPSPPGQLYNTNYQPATSRDSQNSFQLIQRHSPNYELGSNQSQPYARHSPNYAEGVPSYSGDMTNSSSYLNNYTKFLHCTSEYDNTAVPAINNLSPNFDAQTAPAPSLPYTSSATSCGVSPQSCIGASTDCQSMFERSQAQIPSACTNVMQTPLLNYPTTTEYSFAPQQTLPYSASSTFPPHLKSNDFSESNAVIGQSYFQPPPVMLNDNSSLRTSMPLGTDFQNHVSEGLSGSSSSGNWSPSNIQINS